MYFMDAQERENRAAVLLAKTRYDAQLKPWVKDSATRFAYVGKEIDRIIDECVAETGADRAYVKSRLDVILSESAPKADTPDGNDDVNNEGEVKGLGEEEAKKPDESQDVTAASDDDAEAAAENEGLAVAEELEDFLGVSDDEEDDEEEKTSSLADESTWKACFRCGEGLNPVVAAVTPVCRNCTDELRREAAGYEDEISNDDWVPQDDDQAAGGNPTVLFQCRLCAEQGTQNKGTREEILTHLQNEHPELDEQTTEDDGAPAQYDLAGDDTVYSSTKVSDVPGDASHGEKPPVDVAPQQQNPADRFDNIIQETADRAAARQLSLPSDIEVTQIAGQAGLQEDEVRQKLITTAIFGNYTATNGSLDEGGMPDGYTEMTVGEVGGRVDGHQALVPVDIVVGKVADEMGMEHDLVLTQVTDRYGGGALPDKFHASVSGERHFYLPSDIAANTVGPTANPELTQDMQQGAPAQTTPPVPPEETPPYAMSKVNLAAVIEEERAAAKARRSRLAIS